MPQRTRSNGLPPVVIRRSTSGRKKANACPCVPIPLTPAAVFGDPHGPYLAMATACTRSFGIRPWHLTTCTRGFPGSTRRSGFICVQALCVREMILHDYLSCAPSIRAHSSIPYRRNGRYIIVAVIFHNMDMTELTYTYEIKRIV